MRFEFEPRVVHTMAEDDADRTRETEAEHEAEIESELKRVGQDPDQVRDGSDSLGTQRSESGEVDDEADEEADQSTEGST